MEPGVEPGMEPGVEPGMEPGWSQGGARGGARVEPGVEPGWRPWWNSGWSQGWSQAYSRCCLSRLVVPAILNQGTQNLSVCLTHGSSTSESEFPQCKTRVPRIQDPSNLRGSCEEICGEIQTGCNQRILTYFNFRPVSQRRRHVSDPQGFTCRQQVLIPRVLLFLFLITILKGKLTQFTQKFGPSHYPR